MKQEINDVITDVTNETSDIPQQVGKKLEIQDLHVEVSGKEILQGINLTFEPGKVHALMGPNGSGKSTLAHAIIGHPKYKITQGKIILDGKDITNEKADIRAKLGLFLSFQNPQEISGLRINTFLRSALNNVKGKNYSVIEFHKLFKEKMKELNFELGGRNLNEGFSGGEKKKAEMLQLSILEPSFALLDETDSGLDVDSIKIVANSVNMIKEKNEMGVLLITHYNKFIDYLKPDFVSIIYEGKIVKEGGIELAKLIEEKGFEGIVNE